MIICPNGYLTISNETISDVDLQKMYNVKNSMCKATLLAKSLNSTNRYSLNFFWKTPSFRNLLIISKNVHQISLNEFLVSSLKEDHYHSCLRTIIV